MIESMTMKKVVTGRFNEIQRLLVLMTRPTCPCRVLLNSWPLKKAVPQKESNLWVVELQFKEKLAFLPASETRHAGWLWKMTWRWGVPWRCQISHRPFVKNQKEDMTSWRSSETTITRTCLEGSLRKQMQSLHGLFEFSGLSIFSWFRSWEYQLHFWGEEKSRGLLRQARPEMIL